MLFREGTGEAKPGEVWPGTAGPGTARRGSQWLNFDKLTVIVLARRGKAGLGAARLGEAWQGEVANGLNFRNQSTRFATVAT